MRTALAILILCGAISRASLVPLAWSHPSPANVDGFAVWIMRPQQPPQWLLTVQTLWADVTSLPAGRYDVFVTAVKSGIHSDPSNILPIEIPEPPPEDLHIRGMALETSTDLTTWETVAFYDGPRVFVRLRDVQP